MKACHIKEKWKDREETTHCLMWCGKRTVAEKELEAENERRDAASPKISDEEQREIRATMKHCQGCLKAKTKHHGVEYMTSLGFPLPNAMKKKAAVKDAR